MTQIEQVFFRFSFGPENPMEQLGCLAILILFRLCFFLYFLLLPQLLVGPHTHQERTETNSPETIGRCGWTGYQVAIQIGADSKQTSDRQWRSGESWIAVMPTV